MKYLKILLVYLILFPSLVKGDYLDSLLLIYDDMDSKLNIEVANAVMLWLNEQQLSDSVIIFNDEHTKDYIDAQLFAPLSTYFYAQNRYAEAILYSDRGIQAASKISEDDLAAWCYSTLCVVYQRLGDFEKSLHYALNCYEIDLASGKEEHISSSLHNLATISTYNGYITDAFEYIQKAIAIERKLNREDKLSVRLGAAAEIELKLGHYKQALQYAQEAYNLDLQNARFDKAAIRMAQKASVFHSMGQIDSALITYTDAIAVFQNNNMIQSLIISYNALGQLYAIKGDSVLAQQSFLLALQFAKQLNNKVYLQNSYDNLAHLLQKTEPEEAINFLLKANELRKELFEEETQKHIKRFNIEYETREKQLKIDMLEQSLNKSNIIKIGLFVSFILLFLVVLLLAIYIIIRRKYTRELENMNHVKNRYFSILSHDLKNPIIGQRNLLKSTVNYYETIPTSEHKEIVQTLYQSSEILVLLLNNVLQWVKLESKAITPKFTLVDIRTTIIDVVQTLQIDLENKQIDLVLNLPIKSFAHADVIMLNTVIRNLLLNAIKFSYPKGKIEITVQESKTQCCIYIEDFGVGMSDTTQESLFRIDKKITEGTLGEKGSGFGIIICLDMLKQMKSKLLFTSQECHGTTFWFYLKKK